jgi:hypothetical protein
VDAHKYRGYGAGLKKKKRTKKTVSLEYGCNHLFRRDIYSD